MRRWLADARGGQATTFTITDCPCTVTKPIITSTVTTCTEWYAFGPDHVGPDEADWFLNCSPETQAPPPPTVPTVTPIPPPVEPTSFPSVSPPVYTNASTVVVPTPSTTVAPSAPGVTQPSGTAPPAFTGAANKAFAASGAGLVGLVGLAAYLF